MYQHVQYQEDLYGECMHQGGDHFFSFMFVN